MTLHQLRFILKLFSTHCDSDIFVTAMYLGRCAYLMLLLCKQTILAIIMNNMVRLACSDIQPVKRFLQ